VDRDKIPVVVVVVVQVLQAEMPTMGLAAQVLNGQSVQEHFMLAVVVALGEIPADQQLQADQVAVAQALGMIRLSQLVAQILVVAVAQPGHLIQPQ
jgi:hypothetical protein